MPMISEQFICDATGSARRMGFLFGLCTLVLCLTGGPVQAAGEGISIEGNRLTKDGQLWVPKGFTVVGFVAPEARLSEAFHEARKSYGAPMLDHARALGADLLRFQVSQAGLDAQSSIYEAKYLDAIMGAVHQAREKGFSVIISMQWEAPSGLANQPNMPSDLTRRAWTKIASSFGDDRYVMLELFNEPAKWENDPTAWPAWKSGMQSLVEIVRRGGAKNVLLLDGLRGAHSLEGVPPIEDPMHRIVHAVHPYIVEKDRGPKDWNRDFGEFAMHHPVLVTEWNATPMLEKCFPDMPQVSRDLMAYLKERKIGLVLWALDLHRTLFDDNDNPLNFKDFQCGKWGAGAANVAFEYFRSN